MKDQDFMQAAEATHHLNEHFPYVVLLEQGVVLLVITCLLKEISLSHPFNHGHVLVEDRLLRDFSANDLK